MDIFFSFEPTRYDMWIEQYTLNIHMRIMVLEISLPHRLRPSQTTRNKRGRFTAFERQRKVQRVRS